MPDGSIPPVSLIRKQKISAKRIAKNEKVLKKIVDEGQLLKNCKWEWTDTKFDNEIFLEVHLPDYVKKEHIMFEVMTTTAAVHKQLYEKLACARLRAYAHARGRRGVGGRGV